MSRSDSGLVLVEGDVEHPVQGVFDAPVRADGRGNALGVGVADPGRDTALVFLTTASPGESANTMRLRNTVTNRVMAAVPVCG